MVIQLYFVKAGYHLLLQFNFNILGPPAYELWADIFNYKVV
jgi:hypothetical protein